MKLLRHVAVVSISIRSPSTISYVKSFGHPGVYIPGIALLEVCCDSLKDLDLSDNDQMGEVLTLTATGHGSASSFSRHVWFSLCNVLSKVVVRVWSTYELGDSLNVRSKIYLIGGGCRVCNVIALCVKSDSVVRNKLMISTDSPREGCSCAVDFEDAQKS